MTTHRQRLESCLNGDIPDRPPVALWRHFPVDDQSPEGLAAAVLAFQNTYDFDFVKVTPESSFCLKDWGVQDEWQGATEGTRTYIHHVIDHPDDWTRLPLLDPHRGHLNQQLICLGLITKELGPHIPVIQTIFSPLSQAKNLAGRDKLLVHLRQYPEAVHAGLKIITESTIRFMASCAQTGISGIFYAVQHAQYGLLSIGEYRKFGRTYDLEILSETNDLWMNVLHLHGNDVMFDEFIDYPVQVINWHDRETYPSISQGLGKFPRVACGGLSREQSMVLGTPELIRTEAHEAIQSSGGERFILGTGCVIPITTPHGNILAARLSVE